VEGRKTGTERSIICELVSQRCKTFHHTHTTHPQQHRCHPRLDPSHAPSLHFALLLMLLLLENGLYIRQVHRSSKPADKHDQVTRACKGGISESICIQRQLHPKATDDGLHARTNTGASRSRQHDLAHESETGHTQTQHTGDTTSCAPVPTSTHLEHHCDHGCSNR
jgi:hypothetical protein